MANTTSSQKEKSFDNGWTFRWCIRTHRKHIFSLIVRSKQCAVSLTISLAQLFLNAISPFFLCNSSVELVNGEHKKSDESGMFSRYPFDFIETYARSFTLFLFYFNFEFSTNKPQSMKYDRIETELRIFSSALNFLKVQISGRHDVICAKNAILCCRQNDSRVTKATFAMNFEINSQKHKNQILFHIVLCEKSILNISYRENPTSDLR